MLSLDRYPGTWSLGEGPWTAAIQRKQLLALSSDCELLTESNPFWEKTRKKSLVI